MSAAVAPPTDPRGAITEAVSTIALDKIFGPGHSDVKDVISQALNNPGLVDTTFEKNFTYKLAPSYGKLTSASIKQMDDHLVFALDVTMKKLQTAVLASTTDNVISWEEVVSILQQDVAIEPEGDLVHKVDTYTRNSTDFFKVDGGPDDQTVQAVTDWWLKIVDDKDVQDSTAIDIHRLALVVAETGAHISNAADFFLGKEYQEVKILDVGVIRFPDIDHPYLKVYRITVKAFRRSQRVVFVEQNENGLHVEYDMRRYVPRESVISKVKQEVINKAVDELEGLF